MESAFICFFVHSLGIGRENLSNYTDQIPCCCKLVLQIPHSPTFESILQTNETQEEEKTIGSQFVFVIERSRMMGGYRESNVLAKYMVKPIEPMLLGRSNTFWNLNPIDLLHGFPVRYIFSSPLLHFTLPYS